MKSNDRKDFSTLFIQLGLLYGKNVDEFLLEIYWKALERFEFTSVKEAMNAHIINPDIGQYFPKPADVIRFLEGSGQEKWINAWNCVTKAIREVGSYRSVIFDNPLIHAVINDMGGWIALCRATEREMNFKAKEFERNYLKNLRNPPVSYPKQLLGLMATSPTADPPALIGDPDRAREVYSNGVDSIRIPSLTHISEKEISVT